MEKVRYGVIGIKGIGRAHIQAAQANEQIDLVALVDVDETEVVQVAGELGIGAFTGYRHLLDAGIVDAVSIAVPHHLHYPIGLDFLKAGVHVFMEKPFAIRVSEADAMLAVAQKNNLKIAVGHQYRTHRSSQIVKRLIDSGTIGATLRVLWMWGEFRPESYYHRDIWRRTFQYAGGGVLMNQTSHDVDLICWLMGKPVQVSAMVGNHLHEAEIEDIVCANVLFESGAMGSLQFTITHPRGYSIRQIQGDKGIIVMPEVESLTSDQDEEILVGTYEGPLTEMVTELKGIVDQPAISWRSYGLKQDPVQEKIAARILRRLGAVKRPHKWQSNAKPVNGFAVIMNSFIDAISFGGEPLVTGKSARSAVELINAMYLSAMRKKTVDLPLNSHEYDALYEELVKGRLQVPRFRA